MVVAGAFRYTDRYGNFAVPVKMVFVNDNRCISGVFGWDFGLGFIKSFCCMCSPVERYFCFYLIFFLISRMSPGKVVFGVVPAKNVMSPGEVVFGVVPAKNVKLCPR